MDPLFYLLVLLLENVISRPIRLDQPASVGDPIPA